jgi:hypothetical protein
MARIVIDLSHNLPLRAAAPGEKDLAGVFGGELPCVPDGSACSSLSMAPRCCAGFVCRTSTMMGVTFGKCVAA